MEEAIGVVKIMAKNKLGKDLEKAVSKEIPKVEKKVEEGFSELEEYIRGEPLKSVTAAFLIGLFMGKMMK